MVIYKPFSDFITINKLSTVNYNPKVTNIVIWERWGKKNCLTYWRNVGEEELASDVRKEVILTLTNFVYVGIILRNIIELPKNSLAQSLLERH